MTSSNTAMDGAGDPLVGTVIGGKYTIRKLIGRGGVGLVYLATHVTEKQGGRDVVVKVLSPRWAEDSETLARFVREATRLSTLRHPNIVRMFDHDRDGARAYLVMEYCKGELLSDYVERNRALTLEQFVPIAAQLLKGIGHCHSRDMMVRDIKPANVMLVERKGRANFVKVLDFGLAKLLKDDQSVTSEHVMGTVGYLSPEQIRGEALDLRVDVYAVGVLFYFMLSGRLPFDGETNATVFYKTVNEPPPDLREMLPAGSNAPDGLIDLIHRCLEKDRDARPADADAIVERLIDVVPAALFRLPRADTARHGIASNVVPPGHGNTGMMELLGTDKSPSTPIRTVDETELEPPPAPDPVSVPVVPSRPPIGAALGDVAEDSGTKKWIIGAAALVAVVLVVWMASAASGGAPDPPAAPTAAVSAGATQQSATAALDAAREHLDRGELDQAQRKLDDSADDANAAAPSRARHKKLTRELQLRRLLDTGAAFEERGQTREALGAYRDAITVDPTSVAAREAVARLEAAGEATPTLGRAAVTSTPPGTLSIDGAEVGTTPYTGTLAIGTHEVEIHAPGRDPWIGEIEVEAEGLASLGVALTKKGRTPKPRKPPRGTRPAKPAPVAEPEPTPEPAAPATEPAAKPEPQPPAKPGPFLPTKDKDKDPVFLPTKD